MGFWKTARSLNKDGRRLRKKEEAIFNAIKEQPDLVPVSKKLATRSIVFSLLSMVTVILAIVGVHLAINHLATDNLLTTLLLVIPVGAILVYLFAFFVAKAIICLIYQFRLNKKSHTWVALALVILPAILLVVGIIIIAIGSAGKA